MALEEMQKKSLESGLDQWTDARIEAEIQIVRKQQRK
jgi:hypothetical protein